MMQGFSRARRVLLALSTSLWAVSLAGCPGQLDAVPWLPDAGFINPPTIASPDSAPPVMADAAVTAPPKMDAPPPPPAPPRQDAGARPDVGVVASEAWCRDPAEITARIL